MISIYLCELLCFWQLFVNLFGEVLVGLADWFVGHCDGYFCEDGWVCVWDSSSVEDSGMMEFRGVCRADVFVDERSRLGLAQVLSRVCCKNEA